jgi:stearoyl-CoA desaturase (delta-9 desaturase)
VTTAFAHEPSSAPPAPPESRQNLRIRPVNILPILVIHLVCLGVIWVGWSWSAVGVAAALYFVRMFVITAFYHRYFSHRTFQTHRVTQTIAAALGVTSAQRGPVWWAAHHREHHRHSDEVPDLHSPVQHSMLWSHMGWFLSEEGIGFKEKAVPDLCKYPELRAIERWHVLGPVGLALSMFGLGWLLSVIAPNLGTNGWQMVVWGFGISTTVLYHGTFTINSLAHTFGRRRFNTTDDSRNSFLLSLITLGEGWHNNHHYYPGTARQGFYWWEFDPTYYALLLMSKLGLVWDLRRVPSHVYEAARRHARERSGRAA